MKNTFLLTTLFFLGLSIVNFNSIKNESNNINIEPRRLNATASHNWKYCYSYVDGNFEYVFYYDLNHIEYVELYTGVSIEVYDNIDTYINYSISRYSSSSFEKGEVDYMFGANISVDLGFATSELEYNFEKTFGVALNSSFSETISSSLTANDLDGTGTYYLYQNAIITNFKVEQISISTKQVLLSMVDNDVCDQSTFRLELSKKQPKIVLPLLGKC